MNEEQLKVVLKAEFGNFFSQVKDTIKELRKVGKEAKQTKQYVSEFSRALSSDAKALGEAKQKFIDIANAYGKTSDKAQQAAVKIKMLSSALADSKNKYSDLSNLADSFDVTIPQNQEETTNTQNTTSGIESSNSALLEFKDTLEQVRGMGFWDLILSVTSLREGIKKTQRELKGIGGAKDMLKNAFGAFTSTKEQFKDNYGDLFKVGEEVTASLTQRFKMFFGYLGEWAKSSAAAIKASLGAILIVLAAELAVVIGLTKNALNMAKQLKELNTEANKINMSVRAYQEWGYVMKQCGIEAEKLTDFVKKLTEKQKETLNGSEEVTGAFKELGMTQEQVVSMGSEELFAETVEKLQQVENATQRTSIAYRIFTDDAVQLNSVLQLSNDETQSLIDNFYALGAAPSDNLIEKSNILEASTTNLSYAWQGVKNTLAEWVMPAVTAVVQWLTKAIAVVNVFLKALFGVELFTSKSSSGSKGNIGEQYSNGFNKATKAAEKFKRFTMGFDELNVIPSQSTSSSDSSDNSGAFGTGGGNFSADIPIIEAPDISGITEWVEKYKTIIQDVATVSLTIIGILMVVFGFMQGNIPMILAGIGFAGLGIGIGAVDGGTFERWGAAIADFCSKAWTAVKDWVTNTWNSVSTWASDTWNKFKECADNIYKKFIEPVIQFFKDVWDKIVEIFTPVVEWFGKLFKNVWETIKSVFDTIVGIFRGSWEAIKAIWGVVSDWFDEKIIQPVAGFFSGMWSGIKGAASKAWEGIKSVFSPVVEWFKNVFKKAWEGVKNVFSTGGKIFENIKEGISSVFKTVVNHIIDGINTVIAVPFNAINKVLNKVRDVSVAGIEPFKDFIKYNALSIPQIPKLATGGIAVGSVLANVGEAGKEAILPLENNTGWMDILADKIAGRRGTAPTKLVLKIGERELGYATIDSINDITRSTGELPLVFA